MTDMITVIPTQASFLGLKHPNGPPLAKDGSLWPYDGFTCSLLSDGTVKQLYTISEKVDWQDDKGGWHPSHDAVLVEGAKIQPLPAKPEPPAVPLKAPAQPALSSTS